MPVQINQPAKTKNYQVAKWRDFLMVLVIFHEGNGISQNFRNNWFVLKQIKK